MCATPLSPEMKALLDCLCKTKDVEADCSEFDGRAECLAEMLASGVDATEIGPALEAHLQHSCDCREEFEALVSILKAEQCGDLAKTRLPE